ncbi:MAG: helix-turn-helix domain-containing protein [Bacteroidales bacterium]|jgi:AraC-like DNA-binding protein
MDRKETTGISPRDQRFLKSVLAIVQENISNQELNVMWLSRWLGVSRVTLHRKLKSITGLSAGAYIRTVRLDHAARLLNDEGCNIRQAAKGSGFYNLSYFSKCFRAQFGCRPSEFVGHRA